MMNEAFAAAEATASIIFPNALIHSIAKDKE